jgi:hypothetical protein
LLTERISFSRDPADDAVCRSQLLRHQVEMAVESAEYRTVSCFLQRGFGLLLLSLRSLQSVRAATGFLARLGDRKRFGCYSESFRQLD